MTSTIRLGAIFWLLTLEFFVAQFVAGAAFPGYSLLTNDISLLGVTTCGGYINPAPGGIMPVCSPLSLAFNIGMALNGVLVVLGVWLTRTAWPRGKLTTFALWLLTLGGDGSILTGLVPLNVYFPLHAFGAVLALGIADFGFFVLAFVLRKTQPLFAAYCVLTGILTLGGFLIYLSGSDLGMGRGVLERFAAWPHTVWYIVTGLLLLLNARFRPATVRD